MRPILAISLFLSACVPANLPAMQHEVHDEISPETGRRAAARLLDQPALLRIARRLRQNADTPDLVRCYRASLAILGRPIASAMQRPQREHTIHRIQGD